MATLIFYIDDGREVAVPVDGRVKVGSAEGNDVMVEDAGVSARHAEISPTPDGGFHVRDLGSENGTRVNGERIASRNLQHGDDVSFGRLRGRFYLYEAGDALTTEEQAEKKLRALKVAYNETFSKHTALLGVVTSLASQERQKLSSLDRLQTDTLNLETRIANARGLLHQLEESAASASRSASSSPSDGQAASASNIESEQLRETVAKLNNDKLELERGLWELAERRKESEAKREMAEAETSRIRAEHQKLLAEIPALSLKKAEAQASLQEHQTGISSFKKSLSEIALRHAKETESIENLTRERQRLEQDIEAGRAMETKTRDSVAALGKEQAGLTATLQERHEKISRADRELSEQIEQRRQTEAEIEKLRSEREQHDIEMARLVIDLRNLRGAVVDMEARQSAGVELIRLRQEEVRRANESLDKIKETHQDEVHAQEQALNAVLVRLQVAGAQLQETTVINEALSLQNFRLEEVLKKSKIADEKLASLTAQNLHLEDQAVRLSSNLAQRHADLETATEQLTRLRVDESALLKNIESLQESQQTEQRRFDLSVTTHARWDQEAADKHQELETTLEVLRAKVIKLEAYITSLEVWRDDMDEHYALLATMPEDSPEALKLWREIHRKKDRITAQLPPQTGIKPRFNTQVQVVPRGQRPA